VLLEGGERIPMRDLMPGQSVLASNANGELTFSKVLLFLDRVEGEVREFVEISTEDGKTLSLTPSHLIYVDHQTWQNEVSPEDVEESSFVAVFASDVSVGDRVLVAASTGELIPQTVTSKTLKWRQEGAFAPLTETGSVVVDGVAVSCYAVVDSHRVAHLAFAPMRAYHSLTSWLPQSESSSQNGVHWYARTLYSLAESFMSSRLRR